MSVLTIDGFWSWDAVLVGQARKLLADAIAEILPAQHWFGSKTRAILNLAILEAVPISERGQLLVVQVEFESGLKEIYQIPLAFMANGKDVGMSASDPWIIVQQTNGHIEGVFFDALGDAPFCQSLLELVEQNVQIIGASGQIQFKRSARYDTLRDRRSVQCLPRLLTGEQSNSSIVFDDHLIMKLFRRVEPGLNPDYETSEFLAEAGYENTPTLAGTVLYRKDCDTLALAMLQAFVPNRGDAWKFTLDWVNDALQTYLNDDSRGLVARIPSGSYLKTASDGTSPEAESAFRDFLQRAARLGQCTAEMQHRTRFKLRAD